MKPVTGSISRSSSPQISRWSVTHASNSASVVHLRTTMPSLIVDWLIVGATLRRPPRLEIGDVAAACAALSSLAVFQSDSFSGRGTSANLRPRVAATRSISWKRRDEFAVGALERDFGVDVQEACEIDDGEEQVAEFFFGLHRGAVLERVFEFGGFFADFGEDAGGVFPVEAGAGGFFRELQAFECGWNRLGHAVESGHVLGLAVGIFTALLSLDRGPVTQDIFGVLASTSPKTCGWRRIILSWIDWMTSEMLKRFVSEAICE